MGSLTGSASAIASAMLTGAASVPAWPARRPQQLAQQQAERPPARCWRRHVLPNHFRFDRQHLPPQQPPPPLRRPQAATQRRDRHGGRKYQLVHHNLRLRLRHRHSLDSHRRRRCHRHGFERGQHGHRNHRYRRGSLLGLWRCHRHTSCTAEAKRRLSGRFDNHRSSGCDNQRQPGADGTASCWVSGPICGAAASKVAICLSLITTAFATTTATTATAAQLTGFTFGRGDIGLLVWAAAVCATASSLQFGLDGFGCRRGFRLTTATFRALGAFCAQRVGIGRAAFGRSPCCCSRASRSSRSRISWRRA